MQNIQNERKVKNFSLTPKELESFHQRGYAGPFTLYEPEEMKALWQNTRSQMFDRSKAVYQDDAVSGVTNISNYDRHLDVSFLADHICRREIVDRVSSVLGPNMLCWRTEFFPKYPGDEGTDWHQADTFANASGTPQIVWPEDEEFGGTITAWTAFTDATIDNGCLQFIPGTHRTMYYDESKRMHYNPNQINKKEKVDARRGFFGYDYRELQIDPNWKPDESESISMVMRPGQFILFWSTLMHASHPHSGKTKEMRLGYVARYVPTCVRIYPDTDVVEEYGGTISLDKYGAVLVSGENEFNHNRIVKQTTRGKTFNY
ncbi:MAG TPA: chlorinating enzyme [Nostoc sp.]|uniref:chlorinating enzyme n=1 Tax=Nostoc sp. TaxID=1180 RepID=UPI002D2A3BE5|nr:chlorinating enzyme [Nostoc sp.]HYX12949.1 chlorinating enzyme [Nostoc sp.]